MPYTVTKVPDGDVSFGNLNGEFVDLQPVAADYPLGGYPLIDGVSVVNNSALKANVDLYRILTALPAGNNLGYVVEFNTTTKSVVLYQQGAAAGQLTQVATGTDLSALTFRLLLIGL
mgnify:CR=1 FL=1